MKRKWTFLLRLNKSSFPSQLPKKKTLKVKKDSDESNDVQPNVLSDDLVESNHICKCESVLPPLTIKLNNGQETMKRRKIKAVIRFHTPTKAKEPEKFYHHLLMLYFPWRKETDLLGDDQLYWKLRFCFARKGNFTLFGFSLHKR